MEIKWSATSHSTPSKRCHGTVIDSIWLIDLWFCLDQVAWQQPIPKRSINWMCPRLIGRSPRSPDCSTRWRSSPGRTPRRRLAAWRRWAACASLLTNAWRKNRTSFYFCISAAHSHPDGQSMLLDTLSKSVLKCEDIRGWHLYLVISWWCVSAGGGSDREVEAEGTACRRDRDWTYPGWRWR